MYKAYEYPRMKNQCIEKTSSDIDYRLLFTDINSTADVWNILYDENDEEESFRSDHIDPVYTEYSKVFVMLYQIFGLKGREILILMIMSLVWGMYFIIPIKIIGNRSIF